jgi:hypothetical protein
MSDVAKKLGVLRVQIFRAKKSGDVELLKELEEERKALKKSDRMSRQEDMQVHITRSAVHEPVQELDDFEDLRGSTNGIPMFPASACMPSSTSSTASTSTQGPTFTTPVRVSPVCTNDGPRITIVPASIGSPTGVTTHVQTPPTVYVSDSPDIISCTASVSITSLTSIPTNTSGCSGTPAHCSSIVPPNIPISPLDSGIKLASFGSLQEARTYARLEDRFKSTGGTGRSKIRGSYQCAAQGCLCIRKVFPVEGGYDVVQFKEHNHVEKAQGTRVFLKEDAKILANKLCKLGLPPAKLIWYGFLLISHVGVGV